MSWRDLYIYWLSRHIDGRAPSRADIDPPLDLPRLLPNLLLLDWIDGAFRVRVIGSEITRRGGRDDTGQIVDLKLLSEHGIPSFAGLLRRVIETNGPVIYSIGRTDAAAFGAIGILLPLLYPTGAVQMVLGGIFYELDKRHPKNDSWLPGAIAELSLPELLAHPGLPPDPPPESS
jgi:hypothetical protein